MPSAVLNWSTIKFLPAAGATTVAAAYASLTSGIADVTAQADFPWVVASSVTDAAFECLTFKRKSGAAGRLVLGINKTTAVFNPSIDLYTSGTNTANVFFAFYIEGATSDTPTNLKGTGQIFANQDLVNSTPVVLANMSEGNTTGRPCLIANEDSIWFMIRRDVGATPSLGYAIAAGGVLVNDADVPYNAAISFPGSVMSLPSDIATPPARTNQGVMHRRTPTGELEQWVRDAAPGGQLANFLRDQTVKKAYFYPINLASINAITPDRMFYFTLRQVGNGPATLADFEELRDGTGALKAIAATKTSSGSVTVWFCNFKLNV